MHSSLAYVRAAVVAACLSVGCGEVPGGDAMAYIALAGRAATTVSSAGAAGSAGASHVLPPASGGAGAAAGGGTPRAAAAAAGVAADSGGLAAAGMPSAAGAGAAGMAAGTGTAAGAFAASAGVAGTEPAAGGGGAQASQGSCCAGGDCLCHGPDPSELTDGAGPYETAQYTISTGTVVYPTDAEPPFAALALCGGFLNTGPEMAPWGPLYATHGIVLVITSTEAADTPDIRAMKLLAAITELKAENGKSGSPLNGKLSGRYGTSGYSMGGGGTTLASADDATLKTSLGLAPWGGDGSRVKVPTLLFCGDADTVAPCDMAQGVYGGIAEPTPKMLIDVAGATHFNWFDPTDAGGGTSGKYALAFQKVFLEGDERWRPLLLQPPTAAKQTTNIH